uniref:1-acylglycerol-3-phosphate O-acyltransferase n=1 Tax=Apteryx owenii TaxID=8824 RepID=A0A8B9S2W2_APTOW
MDILPIHYPFTFLLITFLVFYHVNPRFRYFCKMSLYKKLWIFISSCLVIIMSAPRGRNVENIKFLRMVFLPLRYIFGIKLVVKGKENLRTKKPFVIVLNHQTSLDIMVAMEILPSRCVPIAKKEILYMGTFGLACWLSGVFFINCKKREDVFSLLQFRVVIFPEGTRNHGGSMLPFKRGAFQGHFHLFLSCFFICTDPYGKITIQILPEVETLDLGPDDVPKLTEQVRDSMLATYQRISAPVLGIGA